MAPSALAGTLSATMLVTVPVVPCGRGDGKREIVAVKKRVKKARTKVGHALVPVERIESRILLIRGRKVMLYADLADIYHVQT